MNTEKNNKVISLQNDYIALLEKELAFATPILAQAGKPVVAEDLAKGVKLVADIKAAKALPVKA